MTVDQGHSFDSDGAKHRQQPPFAEATDRRRPGRPREIRLHLIPLLRFDPSPEEAEALRRRAAATEDTARDDDDDDLRAARGIAFAIASAGLVWAVLGALLIWLW